MTSVHPQGSRLDFEDRPPLGDLLERNRADWSDDLARNDTPEHPIELVPLEQDDVSHRTDREYVADAVREDFRVVAEIQQFWGHGCRLHATPSPRQQHNTGPFHPF